MDFHTALYHCREIEKHFEELNEAPKGQSHGKSIMTRNCEKRLCMDSRQVLISLRELESSIEAQDAETVLGYEDMVDALVDYFDCLIISHEGSDEAKSAGITARKLKAWRESSGKLAQMLCQSAD